MTLAEAISTFGAEAKAKLSNPGVTGAPEDQLRGPLEALIRNLAGLAGLEAGGVVAVGETSLADLGTRPDYAVTRGGALIGFVELKAPGKGLDPRRYRDMHDKEQWKKLRNLPNLVYTDGNGFSLWRDGKLVRMARLEGDVETSGRSLGPGPDVLALFGAFLHWEPQPPRSAAQLAVTTARLCRLLRGEVLEQLARGSAALVNLGTDWRKLLFPEASDAAFADGYAQAVTFGLLMARARGLRLDGGLDQVARELRKTNTLIGAALRLLTDDEDTAATLKMSLDTLARVLDAVEWSEVSKGSPEAWLYFYEEFLREYDNALRKKTGSYYTPPEVVGLMVRLVDDALRSGQRFALSDGLASPDVTVADPAVGTGTYILGVLRRIAETTAADQGDGAVEGIIEAAVSRLIGFEVQFGPFAVAQLRIHAELQSLVGEEGARDVRLFVTDTLGNPYAEEEHIPQMLMPIGESRRHANEIKRQEKITVVIGNPPYKEKAKGLGGWIESGSSGTGDDAPLQQWMPPAEWGLGPHTKHLRNLYVYFWRWATWKVFGDAEASGREGREQDRRGIVCFITVAGYLNGPGFQKMRSELRREADEIWVIDCSPEGHQPPVGTRIFQGVQHPVCVVMAVRSTTGGSHEPARVRYRSLPMGDRQTKFEALDLITLDGDGWTDCPPEPRSSFLPRSVNAWAEFAGLEDLFIYDGAGVMPGRTWVIAPDRPSLERRWKALQSEPDMQEKARLFHPHLVDGKPGDKHIHKSLKRGFHLHGQEYRGRAVASDKGPVVVPVRYAYRSFDRQWIIPDARMINRPNPTLWDVHSEEQIFMTAMQDRSPVNGPAVTFCAAMPDLHHHSGRGGRVFPLWGDGGAREGNLKGACVSVVSEILGTAVHPTDMLAYLAAVAAHPGYTMRFQSDLRQPGLRLPLTADASLFAEAVEVGREVIWVHCFGERFADENGGRPAGPPRLADGDRPTIPKGGAIPTGLAGFPDELAYDSDCGRLEVGSGYIDNVPCAVWEYEVSGKRVLKQWFSYRRRNRSRPIIGDRRTPSPLGHIQPKGWLAEYTTELLNVLHVLGRLVALEPRQEDLLNRVCEGPLIGVDELRARGALDGANVVRRRGNVRQGTLIDEP